MKNTHLHTTLNNNKTKVLLLLFTALFCIGNSFAQNVPLYFSKQTGQFSKFSGSQSKTTDKFENGTVTISTSGPIQYSVDPNDFSIGPNETKTWNGSIFPDVAASPAPGQSAAASVTGSYQVHFKHGGIFDADNNTWITEGTVTDQSGSITKNFIVYSIKVTVPDTICIGNSMEGTATAVPFPNGGGSFNWSAVGQSNGVVLSNTTSQTVGIKMTDSNAVVPIKVVFTIQGITYSANSVIKHCSCRCSNITTGLTFGPIAATFNAPPVSSAPDGQGFCSYDAKNASFSLSMNGVVNKQVAVTNAEITFKRNCQTGAWKDVNITWNGDQDMGDISFINLRLKSLTLGVGTSGSLSGIVTMNVNMNQDKALMNGLVLVRQGVNGNVSFTFNNTNSWSGSFDFSGVHNINIDIVKGAQQTVIGKVQNGNLDAAGTFTGTFSVVGGASYTTDAFRVTMNALSLGTEISILNGLVFTSGSGSVTVDNIARTNGTVNLGLAFGSGNCNASISASNLTALSMTLSDLNLMADFNMNFDLTQIRGSLKAKHNLFDANIDITEFEVKDGSLTKFNGSGKVGYRGFSFDLLSATYAPGLLTINAKVEMNVTVSAMLQVSNMTINDQGNISVGGISGSFDRPPASISFSATMGANRFTGTFTGSLTTISIAGMVDIGAMTDYNFAYLSLTAGVNIPLGQSGLKISTLGGQFGFNYQLTNPVQAGGNPSQGTYVVGLRLGIADMANMCELIGQSVAQFGNGGLQLTLAGTLNVMRTNPYFTGQMSINYLIPANQISGSVGATVKFPSSGWILSTNNTTMNFSVGGGQWSASGNNMTGTLLTHINLTHGFVNFSGSTANALAMTGSLGGRASAGFNYNVNFSGLGCSLGGNMQMNMNSNVSAAINQDGLNGCFGATIDGSGTLSMSNWFFSGDVSVSGSCNGNVCASNNGANVSGTMYINLPFGLQPGINFNIGI